MNVKFLHTAVIMMCIPLVFSSCLFQRRSDEFNDFSTKGFLNESCYQSLVEFHPDANAKGLVKQRESAMAQIKGDETVEYFVLQNLIEYCIQNNISRNYSTQNFINRNITFIKNQLSDELDSYLSDGEIEYKYYSQRNSVIVLHRIKSSNLKGRLQSININSFFPKE